MSAIKTLTSVATAVALVAGIGIATAQSEEQPAQQATMTQATDQAVNDPNAPLQATNPMQTQQTQPVAPAAVDPSLQQPAAPASASAGTSTSAYPAQDNAAGTSSLPADNSSYAPTEPAPRADRN